MKDEMNEPIIIESSLPLSPLVRNVWRMIGLYFNKKIFFGTKCSEGYSIRFGRISVRSDRIPVDKIDTRHKRRVAQFNGQQFFLCSSEEVKIIKDKNGFVISEDIWSPVINMVILNEEQGQLSRDRYGLFLGTYSPRSAGSMEDLLFDFFLEIMRLLSSLLNLSIHPVIPGAPYVIAMSFDIDGFLPDQPSKIISFIKRWNMKIPTFMVMALAHEDATIYDPIYTLDDPSLRIFWDSDVEIGLHSSYLAHDDPRLLIKQKNHLEKNSGREARGHRSHYYRFAFPRSWGHQLNAGFLYDASLGYPDLPGMRNGTSLLVPFPHPDGFPETLWTIATVCLDQHFFNSESLLQWGKKREYIDTLLQHCKERGAILCLDWHLHVIDNLQFPDYFKPLEYILGKAQEDGAEITGLGVLAETVDRRWSSIFKNDFSWDLQLPNGDESKVTAKEKSHYVEVFSRENLGASSIDSAIFSFLSILPEDAEKILDIGSGPGMFSMRLPPFYKVLCMDIDEKIISKCTKYNSIGDITSIPLPDKSADMVMACDILEHLNEGELKKAIAEICRVSRRYLYIQTPLMENLEAGQITCPACGNIWHINYHKQSFTLPRLLHLLPEHWIPQIVNFTGEISWVSLPKEFYGLMKSLGSGQFQKTEIMCPSCNNVYKSDIVPDEVEQIKYITRLANPGGIYNSINHLPVYSEIGILYEFEGESRKDCEPQIRNGRKTLYPLPDPIILTNTSFEYSSPYLETDNFSRAETIPSVIPDQIVTLRTVDGIILYKSPLAKSPSVALFLPCNSEEGDSFSISGNVVKPVSLVIYGYSINGSEYYLGEFNIHGDFCVSLPIPPALYNSYSLFRILWNSLEPIKLKKFSVIEKDKKETYNLQAYKIEGGNSHIELGQEGKLFRWLLPPHDYVIFSHDFNNWLSSLYKSDLKFDLRKIILSYASSTRHIISGLIDAYTGDIVFPYDTLLKDRPVNISPDENNVQKVSLNNVITESLHDDGHVCKGQSFIPENNVVSTELNRDIEVLKVQNRNLLNSLRILEDQLLKINLDDHLMNLEARNKNLLDALQLLEDKSLHLSSNEKNAQERIKSLINITNMLEDNLLFSVEHLLMDRSFNLKLKRRIKKLISFGKNICPSHVKRIAKGIKEKLSK